MTISYLQYKCRRCEEVVQPISAPDGIIALNCIINNLPFPDGWLGVSPGMHGLHYCSDGNVGVTDLIGCEPKRSI